MSIETRRRRRSALAGLLAAAFSIVTPGARAQPSPADFAVAVANDRVQEVKRLLAAGADPDTVDRNGDPVLVIAARAGSAATVDLLLAARANVKARNGFGDTALMVASLGGARRTRPQTPGRGCRRESEGVDGADLCRDRRT